MDETLVRLVWRRAENCCEYCRASQNHYPIPFQIDHIIALKHRGRSTPDNLALSRFHCNSHKGPNLAGIDPVTRKLTPLFHPRRHKWNRHFQWEGGYLTGKTASGRTTVDVLEMNGAFLLELRLELLDEGVGPPSA